MDEYRIYNKEFIEKHGKYIADIKDIELPESIRNAISYYCHPDVKYKMEMNQRDFQHYHFSKGIPNCPTELLQEHEEKCEKILFDNYPELKPIFKTVNRETWIKESFGDYETYLKYHEKYGIE